MPTDPPPANRATVGTNAHLTASICHFGVGMTGHGGIDARSTGAARRHPGMVGFTHPTGRRPEPP